MQFSLSICLIIKNEEKYLRRCLSSIKEIASQIIIVDTGSTDNSIQIAEEFSEQIYFFKWRNDFSLARNFCLDRAEGEWILVLDGDEELDVKCWGPLSEKIQAIDVEAYFLNVKHNLSKSQDKFDIPDFQIRLFRNNGKYRYRGVIHENILDSILDFNSSARIELAREISIMHYGYAEAEIENRYRLKRNADLINKTFFREEDEETKHFHLGQENYNHNNFEEALEHFLFVYEKSNKLHNPKLVSYISLSLFLLNRSFDALDFVDCALAKSPDMGDLYYIKAVIHNNNSQYALAYEAYTECLQAATNLSHLDSTCCQNRPKIYFYLGGLAEYFMDKENALFFFLESLKYDPYMLDSLRRIVKILEPRIYPEYTIESLKRIFDLSDRSLQEEMAAMFYHERAYQLALDFIGQLEARGSISEKLRFIKGLCFLRNKQYFDAEEELQRVNNDVTLYIKAQLHLMLYYWLAQDFRQVSDSLIRIKDAGVDLTTLNVLNMLTSGHSSKTIKISRQVYALVGEIVDLLVELGESCRIDQAFHNLVPLTGERPSRLLAELFYKYGKYDLAQGEFLSRLETDINDAQTYYYLAKICWAQGDLYGAVSFFHQTIKTGLDTPKIRWEAARLHQELATSNLRAGLKHCPETEERQKLVRDFEHILLEI